MRSSEVFLEDTLVVVKLIGKELGIKIRGQGGEVVLVEAKHTVTWSV